MWHWPHVRGRRAMATELVCRAWHAVQLPMLPSSCGLPIGGGCAQCHSIGKPQDDGSIGNCTACHARHTSSVAIARLPRTCGQCHMGPDHSQIEIYEES